MNSSLRTRLWRGSAWLAAGHATGYAASLLRNLLLARTLTKADFGLAAALALTVTASEAATRFSVGQQVVQASDGDTDAFLGSAHLFQVAGGLVAAGIVLIGGVPLAHLLGAADHAWAFAALAALPLINSFQHLDLMRAMRTFSFRERVIADLLPEAVLLAALVPVLHWWPDFRAMLILSFLRAVTGVAVSHALATRAYRWHWEAALAARMATFGWPLALNGVLMFAYQQGDQLVIGSRYPLEELAQYALAFSLTMAPGHLFQHVLNTSMLPLLAQAKDEPALYRRRYLACVRLSATAGALIACALITAGEFTVQLLFGAKYAGAGILIAWLAAANALRIVRSVTAIAAIARGDTLNNPLANLFRLTGLALALLAALNGRPLSWIAASGVVGETIALVVAWRRLERRCGIPLAETRGEVTRAGLFVAGSLGVMMLPAPASTLAATTLGGVAVWVLWRRTPEFHRGRTQTA